MTHYGDVIVIDNGSGMIKAGFAGDELPRSVFPSVCGYTSYQYSIPVRDKLNDTYIGDGALAKSGLLFLKYPIENGIITNWNEMEMILKHTIENELHIDPTEHAFILTAPPRNPKNNIEMMAQMMFETFNVPSFYVATQGYLSLHAHGRTTGIVCECGEGVTQIIPFSEGFALNHAIIRKNIGGRDITNYFQNLLNDQGYYFETSSEREIVRDIKEKHTYVSLDYNAELIKTSNKIEEIHYTLPDGNVCSFTSESFKCTELLFKPILNGFKFEGIHDLLFSSINKCDIEIRKDLYANILLSGGSTMFEGFPERIENEIEKLAPKTMRIKVVAPPERKYATWIGGSIIGSLDGFLQKMITKDEYNENGAQIIHKCL